MFKRLWLENFKGVESGELELNPLTVLLGNNNSAKTTILEALYLAPNPGRFTPYLARKSDGEMGGTPIEILHESRRSLQGFGYAFLLNRYVADEAKIVWEDQSRKTRLILSKEGEWLVVDHIERNPINRLMYARLSSPSVSVHNQQLLTDNSLFISSKFLHFGYNYIGETWHELVNKGIAGDAAEALSKLVNEEYSDFTLEKLGRAGNDLYVYRTDKIRIRVADIGDGAQILAMSLMLTKSTNPKVLLWDDIEAHMNPKLLVYTAGWLADMVKDGAQVVVSTHSLEAVKILTRMAEDMEHRIYLCSLRKGKLEAKGLNANELEELEKAGVDARVAGPLLV